LVEILDTTALPIWCHHFFRQEVRLNAQKGAAARENLRYCDVWLPVQVGCGTARKKLSLCYPAVLGL